MISTLILLCSLLLAVGFVLVYVLRPGWRARIEQPKYQFQEQLQQFERRSGNSVSNHEGSP